MLTQRKNIQIGIKLEKKPFRKTVGTYRQKLTDRHIMSHENHAIAIRICPSRRCGQTAWPFGLNDAAIRPKRQRRSATSATPSFHSRSSGKRHGHAERHIL